MTLVGVHTGRCHMLSRGILWDLHLVWFSLLKIRCHVDCSTRCTAGNVPAFQGVLVVVRDQQEDSGVELRATLFGIKDVKEQMS